LLGIVDFARRHLPRGWSGGSAIQAASLVDMQIEVKSYSNDTLDKSLFEMPSGYARVPANPDDPLVMRP
jgi:hypothetical protein